MKSEKLSTEIAALQRKQKETKNAVAKKALSSKIERLKKELDEITTSAQAKTALAKAQSKIREMSQKDFGEFIKKLSAKSEYSFLKGMSKSKIKDDIMRVAKPVGWRFRGRTNVKKPTKKDIREGNNVYYEGRVNRSDVSRTVRLAEGGGVGDKPLSYYKYETKKVRIAWMGKIQPQAFYSAEEAMKEIEKQSQGIKSEIEKYSIKTPDKTIHLGKEYAIRYAEGGGIKAVEHFRLRGLSFLKDDLMELKDAIQEKNQEGIDKFFSYWGQHLDALRTTNNERMFNFLKDDLDKLENAIQENDQEQIEMFFSYWEQHLESLRFSKGGNLKPIPAGNKGLPKLPKEVRNRMGYMADGGGVGRVKTYKLRAEGLNDFLAFLQTGMYMKIKSFTVEPIGVPDVVVTFETESSLSEIKSKLREIPDSHVMLQTVMPINEYTGERNEEYANGGGVGEMHRSEESGMMARGGMAFSESALKEGLGDVLTHLYKAQNELDGVMSYLDRTGQGGLKSALKKKFHLESLDTTTEKLDNYLEK